MAKINHATKEDVGALKEDVGALKEDVGALKEDLSSLKEDIADILEEKIQEMINVNLSFKSEVLSELQKMREDFDAHQFSHIRINDELTDHNKRLKNLEAAEI